MTQTVLILGATGRFGRNAAAAFARAGWQVRWFCRKTDQLADAAAGADVIVNAWNPAYTDWKALVPKLHADVQQVALRTGATVIIPGNVYGFGPDTPAPWGAQSPLRARNPLGRIRIEMEESYKRAGVRTIVLRAGDFIDTERSGNWFDMVLIKSLAKGVMIYPGRADIPRAWAYLPDLADAAVTLAEQRATLADFVDIPYAGYTLTGTELCAALAQAAGKKLRLKQMNWWPVTLALPFWPMGRCLSEMRYLWDTPHWLDDQRFQSMVPDAPRTPVVEALRRAIA